MPAPPAPPPTPLKKSTLDRLKAAVRELEREAKIITEEEK
jgi:hypothetical protein